MKKRKMRKCKTALIDLSERKNINIIQSDKTSVTDKEMMEFQNIFDNKFKEISSFTNLCIEKNMNKYKDSITDQLFDESMNNMLEQHMLLTHMLNQIKNQKQ